MVKSIKEISSSFNQENLYVFVEIWDKSKVNITSSDLRLRDENKIS